MTSLTSIKPLTIGPVNPLEEQGPSSFNLYLKILF